MKVVQVINALDRADAVSLCLLETDRMLRALGHESEIYYESAHRSLAARGRSVAQLQPDAGDVVLFHYAGYSRILSRVSRVQGKRGLVFHNVTPAHFFEGVPDTYEFCQRAVRQLPELAALFDFGVGVSAFNTETLIELGFEHTRTQPIAHETSGLADVEPDPTACGKWTDDAVKVLVVARVAPHKGLHFAIEALPAVEERLGRRVRLLLVGKTSGYEAYLERLTRIIASAGLEDRVVLTGEVSNAELRAYYECADVLLQLSEHEGFCVPLIEAMAFGVPVVAADAGAVRETLGGAGVLLEDRSPAEVARGIGEALGAGRAGLLTSQQARGGAFSRSEVQKSLADLLAWTADVPRRETPVRLPTVSVVVCTYNRAHVLGRCLEALRRVDYPEFEVVVVEGPSTDETSEILDGFPDVRRVGNPERNLSISRNLGIAASAGEIVAFIDDDAVAESGWLRALTDAFEDPTVGAAGGDVFGPRGDHLQFSNGILSRNGLVIAQQEKPDDRNDPGGAWCNTLMGTNAAFRRRVLDEVGGYDENYEYYHDEADLCVRVIDRGHRVEHSPDAVVWHGFEPGISRKSAYDVDFTVVVKNTIYFALRHNGWRRRPWRLFGPLVTSSIHVAWTLRRFVQREIGVSHAARLLGGWGRGVGQGYQKAFGIEPRCDLGDRTSEPPPRLSAYARAVRPSERRSLHVVLLSQQYPPDDCGGIGVYTEQLARGLVEKGHRVSVLAAGKAAIDRVDGVTVYRVPQAEAPAGIPARCRVTRKNVAHGLGLQELLSWLVRTSGVQIVESPIWDAEGYAASVAGDVPLVLRLNTPIALAAEMQGWDFGADLKLASEMEWALLRNARGVIDPSGTIVETIASRFGAQPGPVPIRTIPFGTPLPPEPMPHDGSEVRFLFLGRLERRKGIDTLMDAIPRVLEAAPHAFFDIAGDGEAEFAPDRLLAMLSPEHRARVRFHGYVGDEERASLYERCDVFVGPSRYESFGIVYIEAMSYGRPCIACDVGGPTQIVRHEKTGLRVPPADPEALGQALIDLARNADLRSSMGRAARRQVAEEYSVEQMVQRSIEVYEEVLAAASSS